MVVNQDFCQCATLDSRFGCITLPSSYLWNLPSKSPYCLLSSTKNMFDCVYPCPRGYYDDSQKPCTCAPVTVSKYQKRISGPLLDRIDIHIEVPRVDYEKLSADRVGESSELIRARVQAACDIQRKRFSMNGSSDIVCNADMRVGEIRQYCKLQDESQRLMRAAMSQLNLSARAYHRILKLARTIADLAGCEEIQSVDLAEALQYRPKLMHSTVC
jgi:magnesium chelatase family protein